MLLPLRLFVHVQSRKTLDYHDYLPSSPAPILASPKQGRNDALLPEPGDDAGAEPKPSLDISGGGAAGAHGEGMVQGSRVEELAAAGADSRVLELGLRVLLYLPPRLEHPQRGVARGAPGRGGGGGPWVEALLWSWGM